MKKLFGSMLRKVNLCQDITLRVRHQSSQTVLNCKVGDNLMDSTNKIVNENVNIYGLCDKQLACTTCSVIIESKVEALEDPTEQQVDVLLGINESVLSESSTIRMACQITLTPQMDGMVVRIPSKSN